MTKLRKDSSQLTAAATTNFFQQSKQRPKRGRPSVCPLETRSSQSQSQAQSQDGFEDPPKKQKPRSLLSAFDKGNENTHDALTSPSSTATTTPSPIHTPHLQKSPSPASPRVARDTPTHNQHHSHTKSFQSPLPPPPLSGQHVSHVSATTVSSHVSTTTDFSVSDMVSHSTASSHHETKTDWLKHLSQHMSQSQSQSTAMSQQYLSQQNESRRTHNLKESTASCTIATTDALLDWSIKHFMRIETTPQSTAQSVTSSSASAFHWATVVPTTAETVGLAEFVRHEDALLPVNCATKTHTSNSSMPYGGSQATADNGVGSLSSFSSSSRSPSPAPTPTSHITLRLMTDFQKALLYWIFSPCPICSSATNLSSTQPAQPAQPAQTAQHIHTPDMFREWGESFRSLYYSFRARLCEYFYCLTQDFSVLFLSVDRQRVKVIVSKSTPDFREALANSGIPFTMPVQNSDSAENGVDDDVLEMPGRRRGSSRANASHQPQTMLIVEGSSAKAHLFFDFLVDYFLTTPPQSAQNPVPLPSLFAPSAFVHASLKALRVRHERGVTTVKNNETSVKHALELSGPILPLSLVHICRILRITQQNGFEATLRTRPDTTVFNLHSKPCARHEQPADSTTASTQHSNLSFANNPLTAKYISTNALDEEGWGDLLDGTMRHLHGRFITQISCTGSNGDAEDAGFNFTAAPCMAALPKNAV